MLSLKSLFAHSLWIAAVTAFNGRATFYAPGLGACGGYNTASDYIVALNIAQYGGGCTGTAHCGQQLTITFGDTSVTATVADCCPGCGYGDLDLTPGLFNRFANPSAGVFYMTWQWGSGAAQQQPSTTTYTPSPTTTQQRTISSSTTRTSSALPSASSASVNHQANNATNIADVNLVLLQMANMVGVTVNQANQGQS